MVNFIYAAAAAVVCQTWEEFSTQRLGFKGEQALQERARR
jgi:hypothetical protein